MSEEIKKNARECDFEVSHWHFEKHIYLID